jgi:hypothetical protein
MGITRIGSQTSVKGPEDWFTGSVENLNCEVAKWMEQVNDEQYDGGK